MKATAAVGPGVGSTGLTWLLLTVDGQEHIAERQLDECVKATTGRARLSGEGA